LVWEKPNGIAGKILSGGHILLILLFSTPVQAAIVEYDLTIAQEQVNITGKPTGAAGCVSGFNPTDS
jgi:hypothetical protein